jgi:Glycosyltransferase family 87
MPVEGALSHAVASDQVARRALEWFVFGVLPAALFCFAIAVAMVDSEGWAFDFRQFWQGGNDVVEGASPYPSAEVLDTAGDHLDPEGIQDVFRFPYPAAAALFFAPFGMLDFDAAAVLWAVVLLASLVGAVWILGVRDWRVLGVVLSSAPVIGAIGIGTLTPLLILLVALAWRWRDTVWVVAGALAAAIALKLFLWPLVVWLAATRRWAAAVAATVLASVVTFAAWGVLGWDGLRAYPELARRLVDVVGDRGFSLVAFGVGSGLPQALAELLPWLVGLLLLAAAVVVAVRREADEAVTFSIALVAAIALTPIVWLHYFALLVVPLALASPTLSLAWGSMWLFWLIPAQENGGELWRVVVALAVTAGVLVLSLSLRQPWAAKAKA